MDYNNDLISKYRDQAVSTMSRGELIVKLYDELLKNLRVASIFINQHNAEGAKKCTAKSRDILNYLIAILDHQYDLSERLNRIYSHMIGQIIKAGATGDAAPIDGIIPIAQELRDAWAQSEKTLRAQNAAQKACDA